MAEDDGGVSVHGCALYELTSGLPSECIGPLLSRNAREGGMSVFRLGSCVMEAMPTEARHCTTEGRNAK
ncbi:hypothetical protein PC116_g7773 [Phytophthora cactorum]|uniref:Uncharacterized protein n=1 Tax=Phytophthora cactorum TaxID=29920 RepID=A0A8T1L8D3_9STRA|nr:hypothetical protein PC111_g11781 [Phytophthora cactorum]KAG2899119.1 hypothetical protein PC114_g14005 [Phytophthora cactorum]KAG2930598.1 hypothetical protein PC117_g13688 [Phytophthora cactorum]KAG3014140.1 hypothetical protein PC120_g12875 [Phytophthora cactorum]KAG3058685.1 hypothetical protein PC121_g14267 [Phytophthora cactorum]